MAILGDYEESFVDSGKERELINKSIQARTKLIKDQIQLMQESKIAHAKEAEEDISIGQAIAMAEKKFENSMTKSTRVLEDDLNE